MAKGKDTKAKKGKDKPAAKKAAAKETASQVEFGVAYIAKKLGVQPAEARRRLRNAEIETAENGRYDFGSAPKADKVVAQLQKKTAKAA